MSLPSKRDQRQLSDAVTETGFINLALEHIDHLPLVQWDTCVACYRKRNHTVLVSHSVLTQ